MPPIVTLHEKDARDERAAHQHLYLLERSIGSTTIYFAPSKPADTKDGNWIQTTPGKGWFPTLAKSLDNYAVLSRDIGRPDEAAPLAARAMAIRAKNALIRNPDGEPER